jgi:hypothetical protein
MRKFLLVILVLSFSATMPNRLSANQSKNASQTIKYGLIITLDPHKDSSNTTKLASKLLGNQVRLSDFNQSIQKNNNNYTMAFAIQMPKAVSLASNLDQIKRNSKGLISNGKLNGFEISEQRGSKADIYRSAFDQSKRIVTFYKNNQITKQVQINGGVTDINSLPFFWLGSKDSSQALSINILDSKKLYQTEFKATKNIFIVDKKRLPVIQYIKTKKSADDSDLIVTVRESDGFPVRIDFGLSAKEGVKMSIYPLHLPSDNFKFN